MPHRYRGAPLKLCLVGDFYLVLCLSKLSELVTVAKTAMSLAIAQAGLHCIGPNASEPVGLARPWVPASPPYHCTKFGQLTAKKNRRMVLPFHAGKLGVCANFRDVPFHILTTERSASHVHQCR
jgi:hypothetical protein